MKTRTIPILTLLLLLVYVSAFAETSAYYDSLVTRANTLYKNAQYDSAKSVYNKVIEAGYESDILYYNLGNAYYKTGDIPAAILNYERALKLNPSNKDAKYNLELANKYISDKIETVPEPLMKSLAINILHLMPVKMWSILSIVFAVIASALLLWFLLSNTSGSKRTAFFLAVAFYGLTLVFYLFAFASFRHIKATDRAIVFSPSTEVMSEPSGSATRLFVVHEGLKVGVVKTEGNWTNVTLPDGSKGWIRSDAIIII